MKKMYYIPLLIIVIVGVSIFLVYQFNNRKIEISFVVAQECSSYELEYDKNLNISEWIILTNKEQKSNWEKAGYVIPFVDFSKNYLIISRYRISKLYRKTTINKCLGVPDGNAIFDKTNSNKNYYYFYLMPKIWLSQGVG